MYKVLASGSTGNAVLYHGNILVDCGVPFSLIRPFASQIQILLLTHEHHDHLNMNTIRAISINRPSLRVGCCKWLSEKLKDIRNVDIYEIGQEYDYGQFTIAPVKLYHDVPNCGYRIIKGNYKIFHATDTLHLKGITAKGYDLYALEHNYDEETIRGTIIRKEANGEFAHERTSLNSHLSEQQARDFIFQNKGDNYEVLRLHESRSFAY